MRHDVSLILSNGPLHRSELKNGDFSSLPLFSSLPSLVLVIFMQKRKFRRKGAKVLHSRRRRMACVGGPATVLGEKRQREREKKGTYRTSEAEETVTERRKKRKIKMKREIETSDSQALRQELLAIGEDVINVIG